MALISPAVRARRPAAAFAVLALALATLQVAQPEGAAATTPVLARYPYLTDLTASSVDVVWATDASDQTPGVVTYGPPGNCGQFTTAASSAATAYTAFGESLAYYRHSVILRNLSASTAYCYRVYTGTTAPGTALLTEPPRFPAGFSTPPAAGASGSFSFDVLGDFGETSLTNHTPLDTYNTYQDAVDTQLAASAASPTAPALFAVSTGDIAYSSGSTTNYGDLNHPADGTGGSAEVSNVFDARYWGKVGSSLPLYSVTGNHGRNSTFFSTWPSATNAAGSAGVYSSATPYPSVDGLPAGNYPSDWYAYTIGGIRFYILDADWSDLSPTSYPNLGTGCPLACPTYQADRDEHWQQASAEYQWLANDLAQDRSARGASAMRLAFFHYPLRVDQNNYTTQQDVYLQNSAANPSGAATSLEALLSGAGVNLVFNGHAHMYERNVAPPGGVPNYVTGGGGGVLTNVAPTASCSATDAYARGWDPSHASGSSCGKPSDSSTAKPTAAAQVYHFLKVTVSGTDVTVSPTDSTGAVFDPMTYHFAPDASAPTIPGAPTAVRGTGYNVVVTRGAASSDNVGVVAYDIYRDGAYRATVPAGVSSWTDVSVPVGTHTWTTVARDQRGNVSPPSAPSAAVTVPDSTAPTAPTLSAAAGPPREIDLSWTGATDNVGVTSYSITRDGAAAATGITTTSWADTGLVAGSTHSYVVTARDAAGNTSPPSNTATATASSGTVPVGPVTNLSASQRSTPGQVSISWSPPSTGSASSYDVYRGAQQLASGLTSTTFLDTAAVDSAPSTYTVVAFDSAGNSASASVSIVADWTAPTQPPGLSVVAVTATTASLTFSTATDAVGVTGYTVRRTDPGGAVSTIATLSASDPRSVTDTGRTPGSTYQYSVTARDAAGNVSTAATAALTMPLFAENFESGSLSTPPWTAPTAGLALQQSVVHAGAWAAEEISTGAATWSAAQLPGTYRAVHASAWVNIRSRSTSAGFLKLRTATGGFIAYLYVNASGYLSVRNDAGNVTHVSTTPVSTGQWHQVECYLDTNPGGPITITAALDGTNVTFSTPVTSTETLGTTPIGQVVLGDTVTGRSYDIAIDDLMLDTQPR